MNDTAGNTSSCLAITEKRPQRPGGCVGIFFQLFDWNRRLAKKKLFSKKLLPAARAKQASKKFVGNEKINTAKLHLIADENRGGFPNVKKNGFHGVDREQKHEMQAPSLVARLMGLESMPPVRRDKAKKALVSDIRHDRGETFASNRNESDRGDMNLEKGQMKHELRPQKLQKTGQFDRRAVTRFGAEALQFKSVLSRSRKHHHPKLASPVKSPRVLSGKSSSRLIDAAARILEPGLLATNRAKCALTYSNSLRYSPKEDAMIEGPTVLSPEMRQTGYYAEATRSLVGQSSCQNCCNHYVSDGVNLRSNEEHPSDFASSASSYVNASSQGLGMSSSRTTISSLDHERDVDFRRCQDQAVFHDSQIKENMRGHNETFRDDSKPFSRDGQERWHFSSQRRKPLRDERTPITLKHVKRTPSQMSLSRERISPRSKHSNLQSRRVSSAVNGISGSKDFVALNRNLSGCTRSRMPTRVDKSTLEADSKYCNRQDESLSHMRTSVRKRRTTNASGQVESTKSVVSSYGKQGNARRDGMAVKGIEVDPCSVNQNCVSKLARKGGGNAAGTNKNIDVISFTFNSPMKQKNVISSPKEMEDQRSDEGNFVNNTTSQRRKLVLDENDGMSSFQKPLPLGGDALGAILVQKLKELTCQEEDELSGGNPPRRTTAVILQELISALTEEQPTSQNDEAIGICRKDDSFCGNHDPHDRLFLHGLMPNGDSTFQARTKTPGNSIGFSLNGDHFSPGSVLEASFSNDSCVSSSLDDNSGYKVHRVHELVDYSYDLPQPSESDGELLDSATSLDKARNGSVMVTDVANFVSKILHMINLSGLVLTGSKLNYVKEVLLNAELLFGIGVSHTSHATKDFSIGSFLLNELETLAAALWTNSECLLVFEEAKEEDELRRFLFDCVIEYLDLKYGKCCKSGFKECTRLTSCMNTLLIREVGEEVRRWTNLAGRIPDEIIDWEMSHSSGKWTDFDVEAFESGAEIGGEILQVLVDEIMTDLCEFRPGYF